MAFEVTDALWELGFLAAVHPGCYYVTVIQSHDVPKILLFLFINVFYSILNHMQHFLR